MSQLTDRMTFDSALMRIFSIIREDPPRFRRALLKGIQATSIITFPVLLFAAATSDHLVVALFGRQWQPAIGPFRVLAFVGLLRSATRAVNAACESIGLVWLQTAFQALSVASVVAGVAVGSSWGLTAASGGVLVAAALSAALNIWLITRYTAVTARDLWHSCWPSLVTGSAMVFTILAVNFGLRRLFVMNDWGYLLADCGTAAVVYPALLIWTPFVSIRTVVQESVDDLVPWLPRLLPLGALQVPTPDIVPAGDAPTRRAV
jgi:O-antigen/teichoic acid export membrane protein